MLDAAGVLKISDFGLCSVYKLKESGKTRLLSERCGSLPYIAPEVSMLQVVQIREVSTTSKLAGNSPYKAEPIDVWGIGVILFTMLVGSESPLFVTRVGHSYGYVVDTPWDEPSDNSFEFCAYVNGEIFDKDPWSRLSPTVLGKTLQSFRRSYRIERVQA